jgi:glycosyltransferase involved in cell wall biosynthesis
LAGDVASTFAPQRIHVVPNGVESWSDETRPPRPPRREFRLLYVANLRLNKGVVDAIKIVEAVNRFGCPARLVLAGPLSRASEIDRIEKAFAAPGVARQIEYRGPVGRDELAILFDECDVVVYPSKDDGQPLVLLEAASASRPFVAYDVGAVGALASRGMGGVVASGDVDGAAQAIVALAADRRALTAAGASARAAYSREFTADAFAQRVFGVIASISG